MVIKQNAFGAGRNIGRLGEGRTSNETSNNEQDQIQQTLIYGSGVWDRVFVATIQTRQT